MLLFYKFQLRCNELWVDFLTKINEKHISMSVKFIDSWNYIVELYICMYNKYMNTLYILYILIHLHIHVLNNLLSVNLTSILRVCGRTALAPQWLVLLVQWSELWGRRQSMLALRLVSSGELWVGTEDTCAFRPLCDLGCSSWQSPTVTAFPDRPALPFHFFQVSVKVAIQLTSQAWR